MFNRESLIASIDCKIFPISIPEWGGDTFIKTFSGKCRAKLDDFISTTKDQMTTEQALSLMAKAICFSLCDEKGKETLTDKDVDLIEGKDIEVITRVFKEVAKVNGLNVTDAVIEAEKKS